MSNIEQNQINIDELAKEKLTEIEKLLDDCTKSHDLASVESWLTILKQIITAAGLHRTSDKDEQNKDKTEENIYADFSDDNEQFNQADLTEQFASNSVKWTIRVRAFALVHRLVRIFSDTKRPDACIRPGKSFFKLKLLPDLIQLSFVAATSPYDDLKLQGFEMFKFIINRFALVEETEFPGQSILDQYRSQVISALKPAFNVDAPPYITAIASQVCCLWICKGLEKSPSDIKRAYQLMATTIDKLENQSQNQNSKLYTESELEQERLDILGSWAQLYITSRDKKFTSALCKFDTSYLLELVTPHLDLLVDKWWEALRDYALLIIPTSRMNTTSHDNGQVYTREVALRLFEPIWPKLILSSTLWLCNNDNSTQEHSKCFRFICGIILKELYRLSGSSYSSLEPKESGETNESTLFALRSLDYLLRIEEFKSALFDDSDVVQEFYSAIYKILINSVKFRSSNYHLSKEILDILLRLVVEKVAVNNTEGLTHILSCLSLMIDEELKGVQSEKSSNIHRTNFAIKVDTIIFIIIKKPIIIEETETFSKVTSTFQRILRYEYDHSVPAYLLKKLKELESDLPQETSSKFTKDLAEARTSALSRLLTSAKVSDDKPSVTSSQSHEKAIVDTKIRNINEQTKANKKPTPKIVLKADFSNFYSSQKVNKL